MPNLNELKEYRAACWTFFFVMSDGTEYIIITDYDLEVTSIAYWDSENSTTGKIIYNKGE